MDMSSPDKDIPKGRSRKGTSLLRYAGMASQFFVAIALSVWLGLKADGFFSFSTPVLVWIFPLLIIVGMFMVILKDTGRRD